MREEVVDSGQGGAGGDNMPCMNTGTFPRIKRLFQRGIEAQVLITLLMI